MKNVIYVSFALIFFVSCQKDDNLKTDVNSLPMKVGNYWIYNVYKIDSLGNETLNTIQDSVIITKDTIVNGKTYFIFEGIASPTTQDRTITKIVRDFSGYLVNSNGEILFSATNFTDTLRSISESYNGQLIYTLTYRLEHVPNQITVPAGTYNVLDYKGTLNAPTFITRYNHNYYANNIGSILSTMRYVSSVDKYYEKRLVRYHLN